MSMCMYILPENEFLTHRLSIMGMSGALPSSGSLVDEVQLRILPPHPYIHFVVVWHQLHHTP